MQQDKMAWFRDAKYGLFIHWGLFSVLGGEYHGQRTDHIAEWIMNYLSIPAAEYRKIAKLFSPASFDADEIVRMAKEEWGMRYLVFTTKHHEGFAMWDSACSDYNVVKATPYGKDVLRQFQLACKKYDMPLGLYYSQAQDWDDEDAYYYGSSRTNSGFARYLEHKCIPQLRELLTGYGKISLVWFDTPMGITAEQCGQLIDLVHTLQPACLISGRIGNGLGDYLTTGDNFIPKDNFLRDWEAPATLNDTWGFNRFDHNWKDPDEIIRLLVKIISRGGNYLLNIGPDGNGTVPPESVRILNTVGRFVLDNAEGIFGTRGVSGYPFDLDWAQFTVRDYKLYVHVLRPRVRLELLNIANGIRGAYLVRNGRALTARSRHICEGESMVEVELPEELRGDRNYTICVELAEKDPIFEPIRG